jgi:cytochrome b6-f complex iron-sulfur subunit
MEVRDRAPAGGARPPRRTFLDLLIKGFLSLWGVGAAALGIAFLKAPSAERRPGERTVRCGPLSSLAVGEARIVRHGAEPLFVVRVSETEAVALSGICTHLRCVLAWNEAAKTIRCPCHAGSFDRDGNVLSGPPQRPLPRYPAEVRAGEILVRL